MTLHAGEADGAESMADALTAGRALRLGHGVQLLNEDPDARSPLSRWIRDRRIALEVCPGSNVALGVYSALAEVPLRRLLDAGAVVALGADDPLLFGADALTSTFWEAEVWPFGHVEFGKDAAFKVLDDLGPRGRHHLSCAADGFVYPGEGRPKDESRKG